MCHRRTSVGAPVAARRSSTTTAAVWQTVMPDENDAATILEATTALDAMNRGFLETVGSSWLWLFSSAGTRFL